MALPWGSRSTTRTRKPSSGERGAEVDRGRGLAHATLLVGDGDDPGELERGHRLGLAWRLSGSGAATRRGGGGSGSGSGSGSRSGLDGWLRVRAPARFGSGSGLTGSGSGSGGLGPRLHSGSGSGRATGGGISAPGPVSSPGLRRCRIRGIRLAPPTPEEAPTLSLIVHIVGHQPSKEESAPRAHRQPRHASGSRTFHVKL